MKLLQLLLLLLSLYIYIYICYSPFSERLGPRGSVAARPPGPPLPPRAARDNIEWLIIFVYSSYNMECHQCRVPRQKSHWGETADYSML